MNRYINDYKKLKEISNIFAFDTETNGLKYDELILNDISFCDGINAFYFNGKINYQEIINIFKKAKIIIGHNLIFDFTVLAKNFGREFLFDISKIELFDTMLAQYSLYPGSHLGLKKLSKSILNEKMVEYKEALSDKSKWTDYSIADAVQTFKLYKHFEKKVEKNIIFKRECKAIIPISDMQNNGFLIDKNKFKEIKESMIKKLKEINIKFIKIFKDLGIEQRSLFGNAVPINLNSNKQLKEFIKDKLKINIEDTGVKTLKYYKNKHIFFETLLEYRHIHKLYNSYIIPFENEHIQSDGKIHSSFNPTGTITGRYSSQNPNQQQIPSFDEFGMRKLFISEKGYKIISIDYAGQELRITAIISKDKNMLNAFKHNKDLHLMTANQVYKLNIPEEALITTNKNYKFYKEKFEQERKKAKFVNFGLIYGASSKGISILTGETEEKSKEMLNNFFKFYSDIKIAIKKNIINLYRNKFVENIFNRKRYFEEIDSKSKRQSFNFLIQGSAADMLKISLYKIWNEIILKYKNDIKLKSTVHDEIIFMIKDEMVDEILPQLIYIMQDFNFEIDILVEPGIGNSYGEAH